MSLWLRFFSPPCIVHWQSQEPGAMNARRYAVGRQCGHLATIAVATCLSFMTDTRCATAWCSVPTARPDATKQFCRVGSGGVNWARVFKRASVSEGETGWSGDHLAATYIAMRCTSSCFCAADRLRVSSGNYRRIESVDGAASRRPPCSRTTTTTRRWDRARLAADVPRLNTCPYSPHTHLLSPAAAPDRLGLTFTFIGL